ncbi:MAG: arginase family protein, partial [Acidimicrobiia bacterium]|nr:arginase family protein [Acidimicrobiia bacterium]
MAIYAVPFFMGDPMPGFRVPVPHHTLTPDLEGPTPQARMAELYRVLADAVAGDTDCPVVYAGDCVAIIGVTAGLQRRGIDASLLFFDAHGDFHTWDTSQSGFIGGMPLAMVTGRGEQTIVEGAGATPLPEERAWLVDGRDLDPGEDTSVAGAAIHHVSAGALLDALPEGGIHLHVDVDVVDPIDMPAVNYPAPGGPSLEEIRTVVAAIHATGRVRAFSISSWNPAYEGADRAADAT